MMKRIASVLFLGVAAVLAGCPIYGDNHAHRVCNSDGCYDCPDDYYTGECVGWECGSSYDCPGGYACTNHTCTPNGSTPPSGTTTCSSPSGCASGQTCGADGTCHTGDCSTSGCPGGYVCKLSGGALACVASGGGGGGGGDGGTFSGCTSDASCTATLGAGAKCLSGACVAPTDQCSDTTQCPAGEQCVQGACTPSCDAGHPCPTGFSCDTGKGVCTGNPTPCGTSGQTCSGGTTCVEQHCVTPCGANNSCGTGLICVDGGCIPDQRPNFVCNTEGVKDACATGSLCLHHSCYIACGADAGANACQAADRYNQCKQVSTSSGTYSVCGSTSNLGSDCDPTQGKNCSSGLICIDGYCR